MSAIQVKLAGKIFNFYEYEDPIVKIEGYTLIMEDIRFDEISSKLEMKGTKNDESFIPNYVIAKLYRGLPSGAAHSPHCEIYKDKNGRIKFFAHYD